MPEREYGEHRISPIKKLEVLETLSTYKTPMSCFLTDLVRAGHKSILKGHRQSLGIQLTMCRSHI